MLTRLIDAGLPKPILISGLIWRLWHVPLILGGVLLVGPPPLLAAALWMVTATAFSFVFARLRLATGSVWPAITLHSAWNAVIQTAFDPASSSAGAELWIGGIGNPRRAHHDCCGRSLLLWAMDDPQDTRIAAEPGKARSDRQAGCESN